MIQTVSQKDRFGKKKKKKEKEKKPKKTKKKMKKAGFFDILIHLLPILVESDFPICFVWELQQKTVSDTHTCCQLRL